MTSTHSEYRKPNSDERNPTHSDNAPRLELVTGGVPVPTGNAALQVEPQDLHKMLTAVLQNASMMPAPDISLADLNRIGQDWIYELMHSKGRSHRTLDDYKISLATLEEYLREIGRTACGESELRMFIDSLAGGLPSRSKEAMPRGSRTRQKHYFNLRACFNWAVKTRRMVRSPLDAIPAPYHKPREIHPFTGDHVRRLLIAAGQLDMADRDVPMLLVLFDCGLRAEEFCDLMFVDYNHDAKTLFVRAGKGDKSRHVPVSPLTAQHLWEYLRLRKRKDYDRLFLNVRGQKMTPNGLLQRFKRIGNHAGISDEEVRVSPHTMRHAFGAFYMMGGGKVENLMRILGHTKPQMSMHYAKLSTEHLTDEHMRHSPVSTLLGKDRGRRK